MALMLLEAIDLLLDEFSSKFQILKHHLVHSNHSSIVDDDDDDSLQFFICLDHRTKQLAIFKSV